MKLFSVGEPIELYINCLCKLLVCLFFGLVNFQSNTMNLIGIHSEGVVSNNVQMIGEQVRDQGLPPI